MDKRIPRGIRNNNPLNIRVGSSWRGEVDSPTDKDFEQFISMRWGLRAGFVLLRRYINRYGLRTIRDIVSRWAPASENNTRAYINAVCSLTGRTELEELAFEDVNTMCNLVWAMAKVETGYALDFTDIVEAYKMAEV